MGHSKRARQAKQMLKQGLITEDNFDEYYPNMSSGNKRNLLKSAGRALKRLPSPDKQVQMQIEGMITDLSMDNVIPMNRAQKRRTLHLNKPMTASTVTQSQNSSPTAEEKKQQEDLQKAMLEAAQSQVNFRVLQPFASCLVEPHQLEEALQSQYNEIYIHVNGNFYKHVKLSGGRHVRIKVKGLPFKFSAIEKSLKTTSISEELNFLPAGKIPYQMWQQIVEFFRQVMKLKKSDMEAQAFIMWSQDRGYYISIPKQEVSKASVRFSHDAESLPPGAVIVVDVHSHNTMGAFFSGTDDNNDKNNICYSAVVGKLKDDSYEWTMRFNLHDVKIKSELSDVFDIREEVEIPKDWLDQVTEPAPYQYSGSAMGKWVGNGTSGSSTSTSTSQSSSGKWTFPKTGGQNADGGRSYDTRKDPGSSPQYPETYEQWCKRQGVSPNQGSSNEGSSGVNSNRGNASLSYQQRGELQELLNGIPSQAGTHLTEAEEEELDRQTTAFLRLHGYGGNGEQLIVEGGGNESKTPFEETSMTTTMNSSGSTEIIEVNEDPVGGSSEHYMEVLHANGKDAADNYELIDDLITCLEGCDNALRDIMTQAYHLMSEKGQEIIQTNGI